MESLETIDYSEADGVAWVTLNRPDQHNSFNRAMNDELHRVWRHLRVNDDVSVAVLTGAGDKAFCVGMDRTESYPQPSSPLMIDAPGPQLGPKGADLWKPVIAAVNGMACGGAFYMLGEVEFIIAAEHATFFDPHVTYGMPSVFEPMLMSGRMPMGEIMRLSIMGNHERMSARRAYEIGLVSEVVPASELHEAAGRAAAAIASQPSVAVQATVRATWAARQMSMGQALGIAPQLVSLGNDEQALRQGQERFEAGQRIDWRLR
ncbi:MAG: enoyl-CoA hydratase/isomerase family protein [Acidimicrobiales bacterium]